MSDMQLTKSQIDEALAEIQDLDVEGKETLSVLDDCEKNLTNIELEEQELINANKKSLQSFAISTDKNTKVPSSLQIRRKKADLKRALVLSDNTEMLITLIPRSRKREIQESMVEPYREAVIAAHNTIKEKIEKLLNALIPKRLRTDRATYGRLPFIEHPGFFWICGPTHNSLQIWVKPDVVYYFEQFKEMDYIRQAYPESKLNAIDNLVERYLKASKTLHSRKISLNARLTKVDTYEDLINFNPDIAETVLNELLAEQNLSIRLILDTMSIDKPKKVKKKSKEVQQESV